MEKKIAVGNENRKNIKTEQKKTKILQNYHDSLPLPIILHILRIFWKKKKQTWVITINYENNLGLLQVMLWILMQKSFTKKAQFHLHHIAEGAMKCCYGILT